MKKEEIQMIGFEIVAYSGDARSKLQAILNMINADTIDVQKFESLIYEADELIKEAHTTQMRMLQEEAKGVDLPYSLTMVHGQDHLMTTILFRDIIKTFIKLSEKVN